MTGRSRRVSRRKGRRSPTNSYAFRFGSFTIPCPSTRPVSSRRQEKPHAILLLIICFQSIFCSSSDGHTDPTVRASRARPSESVPAVGSVPFLLHLEEIPATGHLLAEFPPAGNFRILERGVGAGGKRLTPLAYPTISRVGLNLSERKNRAQIHHHHHRPASFATCSKVVAAGAIFVQRRGSQT